MLFSFSSQWSIDHNRQKVNSFQLSCLSRNWILHRMVNTNVVLSASAWVYNHLEATARPNGATYKSSFYGQVQSICGLAATSLYRMALWSSCSLKFDHCLHQRTTMEGCCWTSTMVRSFWGTWVTERSACDPQISWSFGPQMTLPTI